MADRADKDQSSRSSRKTDETPKAKSNETTSSSPSNEEASASEARAVRRSEKTRKKTGCPVVGIGASAGGLEVLKTFLRHMSSDSGMAFVIVQHLDPKHESLMADLLSRYTDMPVHEAENATPIHSNHVYMIPPGKFIRVDQGGLFLDRPVQHRGMRMPVNHFFRSLAEACGEKAIALVLSGTGSDGSQGIREVKAAGGLTIVQEPSTAEYDGMPRNALDTGMVDLSLKVEDIPHAILNYICHPYVDGDKASPALDEHAPDDFEEVVRLLRAHTNYDFRSYKKGTLNRRIQRRMSLFKCDKLADYVAQLKNDRDEIQALFRDLLISVTRFLRDKDAWDVLQHEAIPDIVSAKRTGDAIRIWVPGCATGEEAYSLAILIADELDKQRKSLEVQIFATDIDEDAVAYAREGLYPDTILQDLPPAYVRRFFVEDGGSYRVVKRLRQMTVFAVQNLIGDPPFSNLDLISCRNLMIYLEADVQGRVIELLHFALNQNGFLFFGTSETLGKHANLFKTISSSARLYRRLERTPKPGRPRFPILRPDQQIARRPQAHRDDHGGGEDSWYASMHRALLDAFVPPAVVVDRRQEVQYYHGAVRDFLRIPEGAPTTDLISMVDDTVRPKLRALLNRVIHGGEAAASVVPQAANAKADLEVRAAPITLGKESYYLVSFNVLHGGQDKRGPGANKQEQPKVSEQERSALAQLEYELSATREDLQSTIEELESSNEELKASNEEVMSMNEELQSTNEELETSREELQSLNEELSTVNNQLEDKVGELQATNDDLSNLLSSTDVATIFLDTGFCIRRFTPATKQLLNILDSDIGRPISDLAPKVNDPDLLVHAEEVLERLHAREAEVKNGGKRWFIRRILPYRTAENKIDGVVVTFTDVTNLKNTAQQLETREHQQAAIALLGKRAIAAETSVSDLLDEAAALIAEHLDVQLVKVLELLDGGGDLLLRAGVGWKRGTVGHAKVSAGVNSQAGFTLQSAVPTIVEDLTKEKRFTGPKLLLDHDVVSGLSIPIGPLDRPWGVLGAHTRSPRNFLVDDINFLQTAANILWEVIERERVESARRATAQRLQIALQVGLMGTWDWDIATDKTIWSDGHYSLLGYQPDTVEPGWEAWESRIYPDDKERVVETVSAARNSDGQFHCEYRVCPTSGQTRWLEARGLFLFDKDDEPERMYGVIIDVEQRKKSEEQQLILLHELDHRVKNILANISALANQTKQGATSVETYVEDFKARIEAIARAHTLLSASRWTGADLETLVSEELSPYRSEDGENLHFGGPAVQLRPDDAQLFAIAVHELATNASKYGALSSPEGKLSVTWAREHHEGAAALVIDWVETGGPPVRKPKAEGFGTTVLTDILPKQLTGEVAVDFKESGVVCRLSIPATRLLKKDSDFRVDGREILSRGGAPEGDIDGSAITLKGKRVLVVEDSVLAAMDIARTLQEAGAIIVGPANSLKKAQSTARAQSIDAAVLDRNLEDGMSDELARQFVKDDIPFIFLTGYSDDHVPQDLQPTLVVGKPFNRGQLQKTLVQAIARARANGGH